MTRLEEVYKDTIVPALTEKFGYKSAMEVPRLQKITLNMGLGEAVGDKKIVEKATGDLATITGQKPVVCLARKSIAGFKIRDEMAIGTKVTLRRAHMYEFLDRLITIAMPRIRDFRGVSAKAFDVFSLRLTTTRSMRSAVWISLLQLLLKQMTKHESYSETSTFRSGSKAVPANG